MIALALARSGATRRANDILSGLAREGHADEETLGLLARTHKDLAAQAGAAAERIRHLTLAFQFYRDAYRRSGGYYSGINAATLALLLGNQEEAAALARAVRDQCRALERADPSRTDLYWVLATLGEAALVNRDWREAEDWYGKAIAAGRHRVGDIVSTRRNARLIARHFDDDRLQLDAVLHVPRVAVFSGHLIDRPGRDTPRFPPSLEPMMRDAIRDHLRNADVGFGYASAGCGGDILFLEALADLGAETHVVLPYNREQFREDSVDIVPGSDWAARYERVLASATEVLEASDERMDGGELSFEYGFLMLDGTAGVRADELDTGLHCLAVWDGKPGDGRGGTAASVERWRDAGRDVAVIDTSRLLPQAGASARPIEAHPRSAPRDERPRHPGFTPGIVGLLFADARGFSKLKEGEVPLFVEQFLGTIAAAARDWPAPLLANTWGDGLYFVFRDVHATGNFALALCQAVRDVDWKAKGFRDDLTLRIGLHAGPVYECVDPITRRPNYIGAHVSRAARIEPITPPGEVYASGSFAALARADQIADFFCAYVGQTPLAKGYGTFPTYVVRRQR